MGSYVESVLGRGEQVKYTARLSIWSMLGMLILGGLLSFVFIGFLFFLAAYLKYRTTELVITNKKVIAKFGFIERDTIELLLPKIESVQVKQSLLGRVFNYGTVIISGAGNPQAPIPGIHDPLRFRNKCMELQEGEEESSVKSPPKKKIIDDPSYDKENDVYVLD